MADRVIRISESEAANNFALLLARVRAGRMDGDNQARGVRVPLSDLLIGVPALKSGYGVATLNVRHFRLIDGLSVVQF